MEALDWERAYARLERARRALELGAERSPEETSRILRERTRALARREGAATPETTASLLVFILAGESYAIDAGQALEVVPVRGLVPVPCTPAVIAGILPHRGHVLTVLDLRVLLGVGAAAHASRVVAVAAAGISFGLLAEEISGLMTIVVEDLREPALSSPGRPHFVRALTEEGTVVLDLEALGSDPRVVVDQHLQPGIPMIVLETAQPVKFGETIREALQREPERPAAFSGIEALPQRFEVLPADTTRVKDFVAAHTVD